MSTTERITLNSAFDGLPLSVMLVRPEGEPRCLVQLAHGMCEHKERYQPFMEFLASRGCLCVIHDHRGHGASVRSAEDLGYFLLGASLGRRLYPRKESRFPVEKVPAPFLCWCGRHSLLIYLLHQPVLAAAVAGIAALT